MVKVMYNDQLVYKVVIWVFWGISLWTDNVALTHDKHGKRSSGEMCWVLSFNAYSST